MMGFGGNGGSSSRPPMGGSSSMGSSGMSDMDDDQDMPQEDDDGMGGKMLALQNLMDAIGQLSDESMRPEIERLKSQIHLGHEAAEGDQMGVDDAENAMQGQDDDSMGPDGKPAIGVEIGMGGPDDGSSDDMSDDEDEDDESGMPKGGFLAILSKKMQKGK